mgnify:FL=1
MANGAVAAVKKGCALYKEIKGAAGQVNDVLKDLEQTFKSKHKDKPPSNDEVKQYNQERERVQTVGKSDPNDVISQIGDQLGTFFDAFDKIETVFWEEERAAKRVYTGDESLSKRALQRVLIRNRLQLMEAEMRELMIYHSPAELKDLWGQFERMRAQITEEQEVARAEQSAKDALESWRRRVKIGQMQDMALEVVLVILALAYLAALIWTLNLHKRGVLQVWLV